MRNMKSDVNLLTCCEVGMLLFTLLQLEEGSQRCVP